MAGNRTGPSVAPVGEDGRLGLSAPTINEPEAADDSVLTQFDRIIDETLSVADSDELSSQFSAEADLKEEPLSKFEKLRSRLAALKRRRRHRVSEMFCLAFFRWRTAPTTRPRRR